MQDYETISKHFSETRKNPQPLSQEMLPLVPDGGAVLDVGCGNGRLFDALREKCVQYTGIDVSGQMIEQAKKRLQRDRVCLDVGSVLELPFHDSSFHVVFAFAALHHIPSRAFRERAMEEIFRVLKKDGVLLMKNWNLYAWTWVKRYRWRLRGLYIPYRNMDRGDVWIPWKMCEGEVIDRYVHVYTKREMGEYLTRSGFQRSHSWYETRGKTAPWWQGENLVTVAWK